MESSKVFQMHTLINEMENRVRIIMHYKFIYVLENFNNRERKKS